MVVYLQQGLHRSRVWIVKFIRHIVKSRHHVRVLHGHVFQYPFDIAIVLGQMGFVISRHQRR